MARCYLMLPSSRSLEQWNRISGQTLPCVAQSKGYLFKGPCNKENLRVYTRDLLFRGTTINNCNGTILLIIQACTLLLSLQKKTGSILMEMYQMSYQTPVGPK